jgi:hypothetical protein
MVEIQGKNRPFPAAVSLGGNVPGKIGVELPVIPGGYVYDPQASIPLFGVVDRTPIILRPKGRVVKDSRTV